MGHRRPSSSSSSSSSLSRSSRSKHEHKEKKEKKVKKHGKVKDHFHNQAPQTSNPPSFPATPQPAGAPWFPAPVQMPIVSDAHAMRIPSPQPPAYQRAPPSGFRIPLTTDTPFPPPEQVGRAPCVEGDGVSPVYFGSALFPNAVHPCKICPHFSDPCRVPYGGTECEHRGRYDLLPFTGDMELIPASGGHVPPGRRPVEGGYEEYNGKNQKLYHAVATINGVRVPGKCGEHLMGANVAFGNAEVYARDYELLVWK